MVEKKQMKCEVMPLTDNEIVKHWQWKHTKEQENARTDFRYLNSDVANWVVSSEPWSTESESESGRFLSWRMSISFYFKVICSKQSKSCRLGKIRTAESYVLASVQNLDSNAFSEADWQNGEPIGIHPGYKGKAAALWTCILERVTLVSGWSRHQVQLINILCI